MFLELSQVFNPFSVPTITAIIVLVPAVLIFQCFEVGALSA
jgi:hypothetical protein